MTTATLDASPAVAQSGLCGAGDLALFFQEPFTVAGRVRSDRQTVADAGAFRAHVKQLLGNADREARQAGYDREYVRLAVYAYVAFLDESVLNSRQAAFAGWARQPLQEEVFGDHMAGETFFRYLDELLGRQDSAELGDVLEVFQLCLLLGFRGRYAGDRERVQSIIATVQQKLQRIRGGDGPLSASWAPTSETIGAARDPWVRRLGVFALASLVATIVLYAVYFLLLGSGARELQGLVSQLVR